MNFVKGCIFEKRYGASLMWCRGNIVGKLLGYHAGTAFFYVFNRVGDQPVRRSRSPRQYLTMLLVWYSR